MIFRTLAPGELDAWCLHCQQVFIGTPQGYFLRHYQLDPDADPALVFIAEEKGQIAATVRVFRRRVRVGGRAYAMGGIGEVSTKPAYRRQGLASRLLQTALETMEREGMALSLLFGDRPIYSQAGYRFVEADRTQAQVAALAALPQGCDMRPFAKGDLPLVMGMYDAFAGRVDGALIRSQAYWTSWVLPQWGDAWVLEVDGRPAAYCVTEGERLQEIAAAPQREELLPALAGAVARRTGVSSLRFLSDLMPQVPGERTRAPLFMAKNLAETEPFARPGFFAVDDF